MRVEDSIRTAGELADIAAHNAALAALEEEDRKKGCTVLTARPEGRGRRGPKAKPSVIHMRWWHSESVKRKMKGVA